MNMGYTHPSEQKEWLDDKTLTAALETEVFNNLSQKEQAEFLNKCRMLKITKFDTELFRIMSLFQYQRRYLEEIPAEIEKHKREMEKYREEVIRLTEQASDGADTIQKRLEEIKEFHGQTEDPVKKATTTATEVVEKMSENLHHTMRTKLKEMEGETDEALHSVRDDVYAHLNNIFCNVQESFCKDLQKCLQTGSAQVMNQILGESLEERSAAAALMNEETRALKSMADTVRKARKDYLSDVRSTKWANWRWCSIAMTAVVLCSWVYFHLFYKEKMEVERTAFARNIRENQAVLDELAKYDRKVELADSNKKGFRAIILRDSSGWSSGKHGVIEFKE
jgi:predicted  nucleic acid-binding Zn-ribbon protein